MSPRLALGDWNHVATFDICCCCLTFTGCLNTKYCKERTRVVCNAHDILSLQLHCPGVSANHQNVHAVGSRSVSGVGDYLAGAAGRYPRQLCNATAGAGRAAFLRLYRGGLAPQGKPTFA